MFEFSTVEDSRDTV